MSTVETFLQKISNHSSESKIYFEDRAYTYKQMVDKSYDLARFLESQNYSKVFFNLKNSPLSFCLYIASWIAYIELLVPINPRLIDKEIEGIIEANSLFLTHSTTCEFRVFAEENDIKTIEVINEIGFLEGLDKTNNFKVFETAITAHVSSGTTGFYKKHRHNIKQIIDYANNRVNDLGLLNDDHLLIALSVNHAFAFSYQLLPVFAMGLNVTIIREFDPEILLEMISNRNITALALLPTMYHFLTKEHICNNKLRYLSVAGDITSKELNKAIKQKLGVSLLNGIGITEVFGYGQNTYANEHVNKVRIFDDTHINIEKFEGNEYGKIFIKNNFLPLGNPTNWLETGDIGSFDNQTKELTFYGRYKDIIIKGGSNISPIELENAILHFDGIEACVVVGKSDKIWGEIICGFIVGDNYSLDDINHHLAKYVAKYKKLDKLIQINEVPMTSTGKIDRKKLKQFINNEH